MWKLIFYYNEQECLKVTFNMGVGGYVAQFCGKLFFTESEHPDQEKLYYFTGQIKAGNDLFKSSDSAVPFKVEATNHRT